MSILATTRRRGAGDATDRRLPPREGEVIDRSRTLGFTWNGARYTGHPGDTIVSALAAAGERVFSRSYKYHRPARAAHRELPRPGHHGAGRRRAERARRAPPASPRACEVSSQNTWPSLRFDVKAVNGLAGRFLATGFYYKTFIKPERLWPAYEKVLRTLRARRRRCSPDTARGYYDKRYAHPDVLVAGGGPAGMAAAVAAARAGASVMLVEEEHQLGGHLRWGGPGDRAALARAARAGRRAAGHRGAHRLGGRRAATTTTGSRSCSAACPASTNG